MAKKRKEFAPGLPDPKRFGRVTTLPLNKPLSWVVQRHLAERAGPHFDIRFGPDRGNKPTLFSWAARRFPSQPGEKAMLFRQPLHTGQYADFEGEIVSGYGKGTVKTHDRGRVIVTQVTPDKIKFVVIHKKHPETFVLVRRSGPPAGTATARTKRTQGGNWLLINTTPTDVIKHKKVHYTKVPASDVEKLFDEKYLHSEKLDGAAALYTLLSDRIEVLSYRPTTKGRPIIHTYRIGGTTNIKIPKHLVGTVLRGELYGVRKGTEQAIPPQELGGILNSATLKALEKKRKQRVELRGAIFNILRYGKKKEIPLSAPLEERLKMLKEVMQYLPKKKFHLPRMAGTPEEQRKMWQEISGGKWPRTHEGIVAWPRAGGKPTKVKLYDEHDVYVTSIFPGKKGLAGKGAGGFKYSLKPGGPEVGEVGTGFSAETRRHMFEHPEEYIGRIARIKAQEQFPSGAYRAPAFLGLHEDYPGVTKPASALGLRSVDVGGKIALEGDVSNPMADIISGVVKAAGGSGDTVADLIKAAGVNPRLVRMPELDLGELPAELKALKPKPPILDRVAAYIARVEPKDIANVRSGVVTMSHAIERIKALSRQLKSVVQPKIPESEYFRSSERLLSDAF